MYPFFYDNRQRRKDEEHDILSQYENFYENEPQQEYEVEQFNLPRTPRRPNVPGFIPGETQNPYLDDYNRRSPNRPYDNNSGRRPSGPPPSTVPSKSRGTNLKAVDPGSIRFCSHNYTYIWLRNGQGFWMYITHVGRRSISGYRWTPFGWVYSGQDLRNIESFFC